LIPYKYKSKKSLLLLGSVIAIIAMPLVVIQVIRSWSKSSDMLRKSVTEYL